MSTPPVSNDPSHDLVFSRRQPLDAIFAPKSVALIGASEQPGSVGRTLLWNLISNPFGGTVYPVNPKRASTLGIRAYPSVTELPEAVDLALIATPAKTVPGIVRQCVDQGIKGAVIISAGFKEIGASGVALEQEILAEARRGAMRIIGPNCLGVMRPTNGLNATFAGAMAEKGNVAFVSQSGALLTSILDWSFRENVGFSAFVSIGSMLDVGWGDMITYLGNDPQTKSILLYMESVGNARSFLSAAREVALHKPIIVIKAGRTQAAAAAAASHTGSLAGSDAVLSTAFRRTGVIRVDEISDLFYMAETLAKQPRPQGPRLTILTNAGGPGVLATDALVSGGGELSVLSEETKAAFSTFLPASWSHGNPVDIIGDADPERYEQSLKVAADDPDSDGLLVVLSPQAMTDATKTARQLAPYAQGNNKPILASWMGGEEVVTGERILNQAGIPTFGYPDTAARLFNYMWRYTYNLRAIYETPVLHEDELGLDIDGAAQIIDHARSAGRTLLTEAESKALLASYGVPTVETRIATTPDEAVSHADDIGYPVVVKLHSFTVTHKVDVGGVKLNLKDADAVRAAFEAVKQGVEAHHEGAFDGVTVQPMVSLTGYELILGSSLDPQFGPVLLFGSGGTLVEVYKDSALGLPPLNSTLAHRMMEQTKIYEALHGIRGRGPVDFETLERTMVRFSELVVDHRAIKEIDINPLLVSEDRILALDARVVLHGPDVDLKTLPKVAIRPYPRRYMRDWTMENGETVSIRPIRPEDEPLVVAFHQKLSEESVYLRYASVLKLDQRVAHERLTRICFIDYDREMALVAERENTETGISEILGISRIIRINGTDAGEFAMLVRDDAQGLGLGTELLRQIVEVGKDEGLQRITADVLAINQPMQKVAQRLGFHVVRSDELDDPMVKLVWTRG